MLSGNSFTQVWHRHDFDDQTRPSGEMLRALSCACFWVILFPSESCPLPFVEYVLYEVLTKRIVDLAGLSFVWSLLGRDILWVMDVSTCG